MKTNDGDAITGLPRILVIYARESSALLAWSFNVKEVEIIYINLHESCIKPM